MKFMILLFSFILFSCGSEIKEEKKFTYSFSFNGCETKVHTFETEEKKCHALKNDDLNNGCATSLRAEEFDRINCEALINESF